MNQRIRYIKHTVPDWMVGNKYYRSNSGEEYRVMFIRLDGDEEHWYGRVLNRDNIVQEVFSTSPHKVKIALKAKLEELGCEFEKETRSKE